MENGAIDDQEAQDAAERLFEVYAPKTVIACERAGLSADGTYRNALGQDYSAGREKPDYIVKGAQNAGIPTIGIGDGGNEIGMGAVKNAVAEHMAAWRCPMRKNSNRCPDSGRRFELGLLRCYSGFGDPAAQPQSRTHARSGTPPA